MKRILCGMVMAAALSGSAFAIDLPSRGYKAPMLADPASNWSGFYVGIHGGGGMANADILDPDGRFFGANTKFHTGFGTAGGQIGYNWQMNSFVFGVEGDLNYMSARSSHPVALANSFFDTTAENFKLDAFGSLRARAGLAVDSTLIYVTGGPGWGHSASSVTSDDLISPLRFQSIDNEWRMGFAAGFGVERMMTQNLVLRAEYLYLDFLSKQQNLIRSDGVLSCGTANCHKDLANTASIARVALSYKFQ